ncbi:MAG TPA: FG-GAP-like repeat-containing protein [Rubricoccaceae bacterium]|nr:FG-GAP-like repeat-containing protein [Rubricoccaceae bacterium]
MPRLPLALVLLLAAPALAQAPRVTAVSPAPETVGAPRDGDLVVQFDAPLDPATVTDASFRVLGRWTGPVAGTLTLEDGDRRVRFTPAAPLFVGDLVLVQLARTITDAGGTPLEHGYAWQFWAEAAPSTLDFSEDYRLSLRQLGEGNVIVYGAHGGDLDGDGDSDLITSQEDANDARVLLNDGEGTYDGFTVHPIPGASVPSPLEGADFDHDGDLDIAIASIANGTVAVLLGDGAGGFESITTYPTAGANGRSVALGDFDGDGHDDIVTASRQDGVLSFLRGHGDGTFDAAVGFAGSGSNETALATADANHDGILDLFVGDNAGGVSVCLGDGDGGFACGPEAGGGLPWMIAAGDINGDGHADVAVASSFANGVEILYGDGAGGFLSTTFLPSGSFNIAIDLGDLDGDGDLDVVSSNYGTADYSVFENVDGAPTFAFTLDAIQAGSCMTLHDRDGDGRLDMTGIDERADYALFFSSPPPPVASEPGAGGGTLSLAPAENPVRGLAHLRLHVPAPAEARLRVFDALGREVAVLLDGAVPAGARTVTWDARGLPAGRYLARLEAGGEVVTAPLVIVR